MTSFSRRTRWDRAPNALAAKLASLDESELMDLTENNPTRVELSYPLAQLDAVFRSAAWFPYEPAPLGLMPAREAVAEYLGNVPAARIALTASTSEAYGALFKLLTDPGDNVLAPRPGYPLIEMLAELEGVETRGYASLHDVESLADERTRAVVVIQPCQPGGAWIAREELKGLERLATRRGWALVSDEVFVPRAELRARSVLALERPPLTFALSGLSKVAGLPQAKLGWMAVAGPVGATREALGRLEVLLDAYLSVGTQVQRALPALLKQAPEFQREVRERLTTNLAALRRVRPSDALWTLQPHDASWSVALRLPDSWDEEQVALQLLERGVKVAPGYWYDFPRGKFLVVSLLVQPELFARGVSAMLAGLASR